MTQDKEPTEADFHRLLEKIKANNPDFDRDVERGKLMIAKREEELTDTERAFLRGNADKLN